jgi:hypothetical protein
MPRCEHHRTLFIPTASMSLLSCQLLGSRLASSSRTRCLFFSLYGWYDLCLGMLAAVSEACRPAPSHPCNPYSL